MNRCGPELRVIPEKLDKGIQSKFPDVEVDWTPKPYVGYWIFCGHRHLWVSIWTFQRHLGLVIRVRKGFEQPDLANILGVPSTAVEINRQVHPTRMNVVVVQIKEDFNPDPETFLQFLKKAHESALSVWG